MTLSFAFSQMYHRRNRPAKRDGPSLWFDELEAGRRRPDLQAGLAGLWRLRPKTRGSRRI